MLNRFVKQRLFWGLLILFMSQHLLATENNLSNNLFSSEQITFSEWENIVNQEMETSSDIIESIWTEDLRPEKVILKWQYKDFSALTECEIFRFSDPKNRMPSTMHIKQEIAGPIYTFEDTSANDTTAFYRYIVRMKDPMIDEYYHSKLAFTVPRPEIEKPECQYVNGNANKISINKNSIEITDPVEWQANSIQYKVKFDGEETSFDWQDLPDNYFIFNLPKEEFDKFDTQQFLLFIKSKDDIGNTSRWSLPVQLTLDVSPPPDVKNLTVWAEINEEATKGWMKVEWQKPDDLSGIKNYIVYRQKPKEKWKSLDKNVPETHYEESFESIETSSKVYYKIGAIDSAGNELYEGEIELIDSARCLIGPEISIEPDLIKDNINYVKTEFVKINCNDYDLDNLIGYNIQYNENSDTTIYSSSATFNAPLDADIQYTIKVQALFKDYKNSEDTLKSLWSNSVTVVREADPPKPVNELRVFNKPPGWAESDNKPWEGNFYLEWIKPSSDAVSYEVLRAHVDSENFETIFDTLITTPIDSICFVDEFDKDGNHEIFAFESYEYKVKACNLFQNGVESLSSDPNLCIRAPIIKRIYPAGSDANNSTKICVKWEPPPTKIEPAKIAYQVRYYRDTYQVPVDTALVNEGDTLKCFILQRQHKYWFEVRGVLEPNTINEIFTAWSLVDSCEPDIIIPPVKTVELQPQPAKEDTPRIFVCWNSYWKENIWEEDNIDTSMVVSFRVERSYDYNNKWIPDKTFEFERFCDEWKKAQFMDSSELKDGQKYRYLVCPYQKTEMGLMSPFGNIPSEVLCEKGKVYIPTIDTLIYFFNPDSNKTYFDGIDDKLIIKWSWPNDPETNDFTKGANRIEVEVSDTSGFEEGGYDFVWRKSVLKDTENWEKREIVFDGISKSPYYVCSGDSLFIRITAMDKWENPHGHWSSDWDTVEVFNDASPPDPTNITDICAKAVQNKNADSVEVTLKWSPQAYDHQSGLKEYRAVRTTQEGDTLESKIIGKPEDSTGSYIVDLENLKKSTEFYYRIDTEDWMRHTNESTKQRPWYALNSPKSFSVHYYDSQHCTMYVELKHVDGATGYCIEWCDDKNNQNPQNQEIIELNPDSLYTIIKHTIGRDSEIQDFMYFALAFQGKSFKENKNESGWTKPVWPIEIDDPPKNFEKHNISHLFNKIPNEFYMNRNYPNPFNTNTQFQFGLPESGCVSVKIINAIGKQIVTLLDSVKPAGYHTIKWDGRDASGFNVSSGIYFWILEYKEIKKVQKCVLIR